MRGYISGPMTGIPDYNFPAFNAAAADLAAAGHDVVNPADNGADESKSWADYLREDIRLVLDCDAVALLPGAMPAAAGPAWLLQARPRGGRKAVDQ